MAARAAAPRTGKPKSDVYTGLLFISLIGMIGSCVLLYLDYDRFKSAPATVVPAASKVGGSAAPAGGAGGQAVPPAGAAGGAGNRGQ